MGNRGDLDRILAVLRENLPELQAEFGVDSLAVFGSTARGQADADSDIDVLVEFEPTPGLFGFLALQERLSTLLEGPVDLVMKTALKPRLRDRVLQEAVAA